MRRVKRLGHVPALDGARGVAILLVVAQHLHAPLAAGGDTGVDLFFILSGFLITKLMIEERESTGRIDLRAFYRRRAFRIIPALVVACLGALAVAYIWRDDARSSIWVEVAYALGFAGNLREVLHPGGGLHLLGATWSLGIEEQFYWIWPAVLIVFPLAFFGRTTHPLPATSSTSTPVSSAQPTGVRTARRLIAAAVVMGLIARIGIGALGGVEQHTLLPFLNMDGLVLGAGLAFAFHHHSMSKPTPVFFARGGHWLLMSVIAVDVYAARWYRFDTFDLRNLVARYAFAALVWWLLTSGRTSAVARLLAHPVLRWFGLISYSLYLWHVLVFAAFGLDEVDGSALPPALAKATGLVVALAVSWLSYRLVEKPAQDFRRRLDRKDSSATTLPISPTAMKSAPEDPSSERSGRSDPTTVTRGV
jgi:peptidoglycan/LPS O-acetylase OafA/YrhL